MKINLKEKEKQKGRTVKFPWDDNDTLYFEIKALPKDQMILLINQSKSNKMQWQKKYKDQEVDIPKFIKLTILEQVVGWEGMNYGHLLRLLDPKTFEYPKGTDAKEAIPFTKESLRILADNYSTSFSTFMTASRDSIEEVLEQEREKELKNL